MIDWILIILFSLTLLYIFLFSLGQLHLAWHYKKQKNQGIQQNSELKNWPIVTVQLPVYNERYVIERLIQNISQLDYPQDKLEIQILDDSTDDSSQIIKDTLARLDHSDQFIHIQRKDRIGFKAGALANGLKQSRGEFLAIFDADFLPSPSFLKTTISAFEEGIGVVQSRWGHINENYDVLTRLQAFGLDAHFTVEQGGRSHAGSFINFNGTGGVWRKECILDAGGWSADTLTEDLDLSYRAQLKGWKFKYLENCVSPAELPVIMPAIKSQQYRWNKGAAETARKNLGKVMKSSLPLVGKFHAFFHLLNSSIFVGLLFAAILSVPIIAVKSSHPELRQFFNIGVVFFIGFLSITYFYALAYRTLKPAKWGGKFIKIFPMFLIISMGLSLHNGLAVIEGLLGKKTPFIRTPKFNTLSNDDKWQGNKYLNLKITPLVILEGLFCLYFIFGLFLGFFIGELGMLPFHLMLSIGFGAVFYFSLKPVVNA